MIMMASSRDGNTRYSQTKTSRSMFRKRSRAGDLLRTGSSWRKTSDPVV